MMERRSESDAAPVWGPLAIYNLYVYTNTHTRSSNIWI